MRIHVYASPRYVTVVHDDGSIFQIEPHELNLQFRTKKEAEAIAALTSLDNFPDITEVCSDEELDESALGTVVSQIKGRRDRKRLAKLVPRLHEIRFSKIPGRDNRAAIVDAQTP
jgi:hypothetical protein